MFSPDEQMRASRRGVVKTKIFKMSKRERPLKENDALQIIPWNHLQCI